MFHRFGASFLTEYLGFHVLARATHQIEDHITHWWYYLWVLLISAAPFVLLYPFAIVDSFRQKRTSRLGDLCRGRCRLLHRGPDPSAPLHRTGLSSARTAHLRLPRRPTQRAAAKTPTIAQSLSGRQSRSSRLSICIASAFLTSGSATNTSIKPKSAPISSLQKRSRSSFCATSSANRSQSRARFSSGGRATQRSIATSVFYCGRPVQQVQLQPLPAGVPTDKYLFQPETLDDALASGPRIILLDKYLVQQIPSKFLLQTDRLRTVDGSRSYRPKITAAWLAKILHPLFPASPYLF